MKIGGKMTEKTKAKISQALKGKTPKNIVGGWNKGKKTGLVPKTAFKKDVASWNKGLPRTWKSPGDFVKGNIGEKCPAWKGGVAKVHELIRGSLEIKLWKKACMVRDNFTCQKTGQRGGSIVVHHINNFADFPELRTVVENGITLSKEAHDLFHQKYGKGNNTREQLEEFLNNKTL